MRFISGAPRGYLIIIIISLDPGCRFFPDRTIDLEAALYEPHPALNAAVFTLFH
jgi:hypothetical protein